MISRDEYETKAKTVVDALFPDLERAARDALVFLIVDALLSLDALAER